MEFLENSKIELGEPRGWEATLSQMPRGVSLVPEVSFRNPADFLPHSSSRRAHPSPAEQVRDGVEVANWIHQLEATHCGGGWNGGPPGSQAERKGSKVVSPQEGDSRAGPLGEGCWQVMVGVLQTEIHISAAPSQWRGPGAGGLPTVLSVVMLSLAPHPCGSPVPAAARLFPRPLGPEVWLSGRPKGGTEGPTGGGSS